jgi:hypothetical protein
LRCLHRNLDSTQPTAIPETEAKKKLIAKTPLGIPWIEPEAIAPIVVFLASDDAHMVSGATYDACARDFAMRQHYVPMQEQKDEPGPGETLPSLLAAVAVIW